MHFVPLLGGGRLLNTACRRFYGGNNTFYHTIQEDSTSYFVVTKETYVYGGLFDLTFEPVECPGLDSCSEAGVISGLPFVSKDRPFRFSEILLSWFLCLQVTFGSNVFAFPEPNGSPANSCRLSHDSRTQWYYLPASLAQDRCYSIFLFSEFASVLSVFESFDEACEKLSCLYYNSYFNGFARFRVESVSPRVWHGAMEILSLTVYISLRLRFTLLSVVHHNMITVTTSLRWTKSTVMLSPQTQTVASPRQSTQFRQLSKQIFLVSRNLVIIFLLAHVIYTTNGKLSGTVE